MKIGVVFEGKLNHLTGVVYRLIFVKDIKSLEIVTFLIANYCLFSLVVVTGSAESHSLTMATFTLDQYLGLAWEILALLASVAKLWAEMLTITSFLVARLLTRLCFTGLLAGPFMTLKTTFMVTRKSLRAFSQAKGLSSTCSLDLFLSTPTSNCDIFETFTGTIVAIILAFMATCHLSITNILALGNY